MFVWRIDFNPGFFFVFFAKQLPFRRRRRRVPGGHQHHCACSRLPIHGTRPARFSAYPGADAAAARRCHACAARWGLLLHVHQQLCPELGADAALQQRTATDLEPDRTSIPKFSKSFPAETQIKSPVPREKKKGRPSLQVKDGLKVNESNSIRKRLTLICFELSTHYHTHTYI